VAAGTPARLDTDRALVRRLGHAGSPSYGWADTSAGRVRYAVVPVTVPGDRAQGQLVAVEFRDRE
jgi:hypothetical protein